MNRIYEVGEGRPVWKLRPVMLLVTLVTVVLAALVALALVVTGPAAQAVGDAIGLGSTAVMVWNIAKWPVMLRVVVLIVALLYYATPNVKQPKFRWLSVGAVLAIVVWIVASAAFGFYVANFSSYNKTYGALAGVIVFLLWLWITNLALLFGAELDAELERGRELQAGIAAEETSSCRRGTPRSIDKASEKERRGHRARPSAAQRPAARPRTPRNDQEEQSDATTEQHGSKSAKILYRPVGLISSVLAGLVAGRSSSRSGSTPPPATRTTRPRRWSRSTPVRGAHRRGRPGRDLRGRQPR